MDDPFRQSRSRLWVKLLVVVAAIVAAFFGIKYATKAYRVHHAATALASVHKCVFGAPLAKGEHPSGRLHRIVIGNPPADWPARCQKYVQDFEEVDEALHGIDLQAPLAVIDVQGLMHGSNYGFDAYFESRTDVGDAPDDVPSAPPFVDVADDRTPPLVFRGSLIGASFDPIPGADLDFVVGGTTLCRSAAPLQTIKCTLGALSPKGSLWPGSADGGPLLVSPSSEGWQTSHDSIRKLEDARPLCTDETRSCTAFGESDGSVLVLSRMSSKPGADYTFSYAAARDHGAPVDAKWTTSSGAEVRLVGDRAIWTDTDAHGDDHLFVKRFTGVTPSATEDLGAVARGPFGACFLRTGVAVYGSSWATILHDGSHSPVHAFTTMDSASTASCGDDALTLTSVSGNVVNVVRCNDAGCTPDRVDLGKSFARLPDDRRPARDAVAAVALGDALVVVWRSVRQGFRVRVAPLASIDRAEDHVAYDDAISSGMAFVWSVVQDPFRLVARRDAAVLLIETIDTNPGIKAFRIGRDGVIGTLR